VGAAAGACANDVAPTINDKLKQNRVRMNALSLDLTMTGAIRGREWDGKRRL